MTKYYSIVLDFFEHAIEQQESGWDLFILLFVTYNHRTQHELMNSFIAMVTKIFMNTLRLT